MALSVDKFKFGNESIADMYFGMLSVKQLYFGNVLIWEKGGTVRTLVYSTDAWDGYVYSYFTPTSDLDIKAIEAFTDIGNGSYTKEAWILDAETSMTIGYGTAESTSQIAETRYEQNGYSRIITFNNTVHLKANKKYIILFKRNSNESTAFKLSYFDGEQRSEVITNTTDASLPSTNVVDLTNETYGGVIDSSKTEPADVLDSFMGSSGLYRYDSSTSIITNQSVNLEQYHYYKSNYSNVWKGRVETDGTWYNNWASPSLDALKSLSANDVACTEKHDIEQNYGAFVFKRTDVKIPDFNKSVTIGGSYDISNLRNALLNDLSISTNGSGQNFLNTTDWTSWQSGIGKLNANTVYSATSADYITDDLSTSYSNPPANPQEKYLYWYQDNGNWSIYQCVNGALTPISLNTIFHTVQEIDKSTLITQITDALTNVGIANTVVLNGSPTTGKNYYYNLIKTDDTRVEV